MLKQSLRSFSVMLKYARIPTLISIAGMLLEALEAPLAIYFTGRLVNGIAAYISGNTPVYEPLMWGLLLVTALLLAAAAGAFRNMSSVYCLRALNKRFAYVVLNKFRRIEYACFEAPDILDSIERMGAEPQQRIYELFSRTGSAIATLVSLIGAAIVTAQISVLFAVVYLVLLAPMLWLDFKWEEEIQRLWNTEMPNWRRRTYLSALMADKNSMFELKLFGAVDYTLHRWKFYADTFHNEYRHTKIASSKYGVLRDLSLAAWSVYVILSLLSRLQSGTVSLGAFTACITSMGTILALSQTLSRMFSLVSQDCLIMRHFDIFMNLPEIPSGENVATQQQSVGVVRFDNVSFTYPKTDKQILQGVSFELRAGERVALVGENGAGKSTIVKLLCGLYAPTGGEIYIDDKPIGTLTAQERRFVFSTVFQDYVSYELTLRENVAFGDISKLRNDELIAAALHRGLWDDSQEAQISLDTNLGKLEDDGVDLSGGQWQRVAVARALISDAAFIILDEPTAALDPLAESRMYDTFHSALTGRGCIMISHRLASARLADKIVVLDGGVAAEIGTHEQLMRSGGLYRGMFDAQADWYADGGLGK